MVTDLDIEVGQTYTLKLEGLDVPVFAEFAKEMRDGRLMFRREGTDRELYLDLDEFERMRSDGDAKRIRLDRDGRLIESVEIDPVSFLDPDEPGISLKERQLRLKQGEKLRWKQMVRFYVMRYDEEGVQPRGRLAVAKIIKKHRAAAVEAGHTQGPPSPSTLLRAVDECGTPGERPLVAFFSDRKVESRQKRWPKEIVEAADRAIEAYWDDATITIGDAIDQFRLESIYIAKRHHVPMLGDEHTDQASEDKEYFPIHRLDPETPDAPYADDASDYPVPCDETIRLWIHQNADWYHWAQRHGVDNANRRYKGRGRTIEATRPLEYVMFDHTKIDAWAVVMDDEGQPLFVARAWLTLAIDCYSRMILGAVVGYEPPSIHSVVACLKQVVRKKEFLSEYGEWKGAADGWGRPFTIIVDNGKEFVSPSFQASCEAAGIDVIWAPVKMPTYKAYVERVFGTLNTMLWHRLPGGLPLTPQQRQQLGLEKEAEAVFTKAQLEKAMWNAIVLKYHTKVHSGIDMAPALKWQRGLSLHKRATVDDVEILERIVGKAKNGLLTAEGVTVEGHRFHDPEITSMLMNRLGPAAKLSRQRRGVTSSRTVNVRVTWDPGDVTKVYVFDFTTNTSVMLPNWHRQFSHDLSWYAARKIKEWAAERNMKFHSDAERAHARLAHRQYLIDIMPGIKSVERQRRARVIEPLKELVPGDRVEIVQVDRSSIDDQPHDTAARRAEHPLAVKKGKVFGGNSGARNASEKRKKKREAKAAETREPVAPVQIPKPESGVRAKLDIAAIRASVAARLNNKTDNDGEAA
jgi:putative transposase